MLEQINTWLSHWEPSWLFIVLHFECLSGWVGVFYLAKRLAIVTAKKQVNRKKKEEFECLTKGEGR